MKIADRNPNLLYNDIVDEVLEEFGGVHEVIEVNENELSNEWLIIALMRDWRVFLYVIKPNEFSCLSKEERKQKINRECIIFEDMDDWSVWQELDGSATDNFKQKIIDKQKQEYDAKYNDALADFFSGNISSISKVMSSTSSLK